jgi:hypothetical protein
MTLTARQKAKIDAYAIVPSRATVDSVMRSFVTDSRFARARVDFELAPIMAEKLVHTYAKIQEAKYPEFLAAAGQILPIDSSPGPESEKWRYWLIDYAGRCDWIDEGGSYAPSSAIKMRQFEGKFARFGHRWETTIFDLRRAAAADVPLEATKGKLSKKAHEAWKDWHWSVGSIGHEVEGLLTNPNITHMLAPFDSASGNTTRLWPGKSDTDIREDVRAVVTRIQNDTKGAELCARIFLPRGLVQEAQSRYIAATATGTVTLWDQIVDAWKGDPVTGQGKVTFHTWQMLDADERIDPVSVTSEDGSGGTDTSGISGDCILGCPAMDADMDAFVLAYPFSQEPPLPDPESFRIFTKTHERMGGARVQRPKAYVLMRFGTT